MKAFFERIIIKMIGRPLVQGSIDLHHDIFFFLILILVFVSRMLVRALWHFHEQTNPIPQRIVHGTTIANLWNTILNIFLAAFPFLVSRSIGAWEAECQPPAGDEPGTESEASGAPTEASSSSWTAVLMGSSSVSETDTETESTARSMAQPLPPANPGEAAGQPEEIAPVAPYPYHPDDSVIGGDSVRQIQLRLLASEPLPSVDRCYLTRLEAEDLFEVKAEIIQQMSVLDPMGNWLERGAEALANPRAAYGEHKLETLCGIRDNLREHGARSEDFCSLTRKMISRRELHDANSET